MRIIRSTLASNEGTGLASALIALAIMAVFALVASQLAVNERRASFLDLVHASALMAADAGGEDAVSWVAKQTAPPPIQDFATYKVTDSAATSMHESQEYEFDVAFVRVQPRVGYDLSHVDFVYDVDSLGDFAEKGNSTVGLVVQKLNRSGHQGN